MTQVANISVIIPVFNRAALLDITLDNITRQSLLPKEIIVVDDRSTEDTESVVKKYASFGARFMLNEGKGPGAGRNTGYKASSGTFIKFFDSDDLMTLNTLEVQLNALQERDADFVYSPYVHAREVEGAWVQDDVIIQYEPIPSYFTMQQCMVRGFFTIIPSMMFKREGWEKVAPWREDLVAYEDWHLLWNMGLANLKATHVNDCCTIYRIHGTQTTGTNFRNDARDKMKVQCFIDCLNEPLAQQQLPAVERALLNSQIVNTLNYLQAEKEYQELRLRLTHPLSKPLSVFLKLDNKINRLATGSSWQLFHGVNKDPQAFNHYIQNL